MREGLKRMSPTTGLQDVSARAGGDASNRALHVAIIMDGNGRWAKRRGMPRALGHRAGVTALKRTVEAAPELGVGVMTVFGFSTENWRRPPRRSPS
jgi:undecaprenyl diphosphate synthase